MKYVVRFSEGRLLVVPSGEAKTWALLSYECGNCNVYALGGAPIPLYVTDIR